MFVNHLIRHIARFDFAVYLPLHCKSCVSCSDVVSIPRRYHT